jgi:hypothetical protein
MVNMGTSLGLSCQASSSELLLCSGMAGKKPSDGSCTGGSESVLEWPRFIRER